MGISPRLSDNYVLDRANDNTQGEFVSLAGNRDYLGRDYLTSYAATEDPREAHYRPYIEMIEKLYPDKAPEDIVAFTDLYYCAYPAKPPYYDPAYQPLPANSPCAAEFFGRLIEQVRPRAVITRGEPQKRFFKRYYVAHDVNYNATYNITVKGVATVLVSLKWQMDMQWLMTTIRAIDSEAR